MKEYTLWALPKGETDRLHERVLASTTDRASVEKVKTPAAADGWHGFRVQVIDCAIPDFGACVNRIR